MPSQLSKYVSLSLLSHSSNLGVSKAYLSCLRAFMPTGRFVGLNHRAGGNLHWVELHRYKDERKGTVIG
jgi:hypothetical protein